MKANIYELTCRFDARASFYGKAQVIQEEGVETLCSYSVPVVQLKDGVITFGPRWCDSQTTLRHVKEYLKQKSSVMGNMTKSELKEYIEEHNLIGNFA